MTRQTFFGKVMSLLFNMLSRLVISFLPRIKHIVVQYMLIYSIWHTVYVYIVVYAHTIHTDSICISILSHISRVRSVRPHRRQPTRLRHPWDSPGKNTGVGCHFFLQCMKVKSESEVAQSSPTLSDTRVCSLPGSSIHGILQASILEWGAISFSSI